MIRKYNGSLLISTKAKITSSYIWINAKITDLQQKESQSKGDHRPNVLAVLKKKLPNCHEVRL